MAELLGALLGYTLLALLMWKVVYVKGAPWGKKWVKVVVGTLIAVIMTVIVLGTIFQGLSSSSAQDDVTSASTQPRKVEVPDPLEMLRLVNLEREKVGVAPLTLDARLSQSAQMKADDMYYGSYYDHVNPQTGKHGYTYIFDTTGKLCSHASENLMESTDNTTGELVTVSSEETVRAWMGSKSHREAILNPDYKLTGFGVKGPKTVEHFCKLAQ